MQRGLSCKKAMMLARLMVLETAAMMVMRDEEGAGSYSDYSKEGDNSHGSCEVNKQGCQFSVNLRNSVNPIWSVCPP